MKLRGKRLAGDAVGIGFGLLYYTALVGIPLATLAIWLRS